MRRRGAAAPTVRFSVDGAWTAWRELENDGVLARGRSFAELVNAAGADAYQVAGPAADVRAVAINTTDGPRFKDGKEVWAPTFHPTQKLVVHHTATRNDDPDPAATVRAIYRYHPIDKGWGDIGCNFLVDAQGRVYKGRWSGAVASTTGDI